MPGVNVTITNAPAPASRPTETGKLFAVGQTEHGSATVPITVHSPAEFKRRLGSAVAGSYLATAAESFFQEGGATLIVGRVTGSAASAASVELEKTGGTKVLKATAKSVGIWGNSLKVEVKTESSNFAIIVTKNNEVVEEKKELATLAAAVTWSEETSEYITLSIVGGATENPKAQGPTILTGGSEGTINSAAYETALNLFDPELGCGQVAAPGVTEEAVQILVLAHAEKNNRFALIDLPNSTSVATLKSAAAALAKKTGARRGAAFSSWAVIPGLVPNTTRTSPWSTVQAGIIARNDASASPPPVNEASAGENGKPRYVQSLAAEFTRAQREELNEDRINAIRNMPGEGGFETYGNVTLVSAEEQPPWAQITAARLFMYVISEGEAILERFVFDEIDPHRLIFGKAGAALQAFLESLGNQLFNNPREAVNTGPSVNTEETIKKKQIIAAVQVKPSPSAETVTLNITAESV